MGYLSLVPVLLMASFIHYGDAVRCWTCSSDVNPLCNDPFTAGRSDSNSYLYKIENCVQSGGIGYPYQSFNTKSVCMKQIKFINSQQVVTRGCTWKHQDDYSTSCPSSSYNGPYEVSSYCQTCEYDLCNGAATITKTLALILAPLGLLLFK